MSGTAGCMISNSPRYLPKRNERLYPQKIIQECSWIAALFLEAKTWKQSSCPSTEDE